MTKNKTNHKKRCLTLSISIYALLYIKTLPAISPTVEKNSVLIKSKIKIKVIFTPLNSTNSHSTINSLPVKKIKVIIKPNIEKLSKKQENKYLLIILNFIILIC